MSERPESLLLYGATDVGKSSQLGEIAKWHYAKTGEISRLISADSGWQPLEELIITEANPDGIIEAWNIQNLIDPWVVLVELSEGAWPQVTQGSTGPKLKMVRPTWKDGRVQSDGRPVGQWFIEGISTLGSTALQDHQRTARKLSQDVVAPFYSKTTEILVGPDGKVVVGPDGKPRESERTETFSAASPSHYGQVQRFILEDLVPRFGRLSCARVVWTGHEAKGKDEITGIDNSALGPAIVGRAAVDRTTLKFGHSFHMTVDTQYTKDAKGQPVVNRDFRAYFVSHPDEVLTKMKWPAKVSLPIARSRELLEKFPGGYIPLNGKSLAQFLEFLHPEVVKQ